jgi:hypothetical protein
VPRGFPFFRTAKRPVTPEIRTRLFLLHWLTLPLLMFSLVTGLRQFTANRLASDPALLAWLPTGNVHAWHLAAAAAWGVLAFAFVLHRIARRSDGAASDVEENKETAGRAFAIGVINAGKTLLTLLLLSGAGLYLGGAGRFDGALLTVHLALALAVPVWLILHAASASRRGLTAALRRVFAGPALHRLRWRQAALAVPLAFGILLVVSRDELHTAGLQTLPVLEIAIEEAIDTDGMATEPAWQRAKVVEVLTTTVGNATAAVPVRVQALRQGGVAHFLFSWPDTTPSFEHLPLLKTAQGWVVQQTTLARHDENVFYEDKFAVLLANGSDAAGDGSVRLGRHAIDGMPPSESGRGYHAAGAGLVDVWHWKSVRNHLTDQLDDNHFASPYPHIPGETRYTGGYKPDPSISGGYSENWTWFREGVVTPKRLPQDPGLLAPFQTAAAADSSEPPVWGLSWYETRPYQPAHDTYPVGTRMPSVLWTTVFEGDRGDVRARGRWQEDRWTLEVVRGVKAESPFDLDISDGTFLWVAPFDHAQTRHAYHLRPLRLAFSKEQPL